MCHEVRGHGCHLCASGPKQLWAQEGIRPQEAVDHLQSQIAGWAPGCQTIFLPLQFGQGKANWLPHRPFAHP